MIEEMSSLEDKIVKVDFSYFISLALQNKITWESLSSILDDFIPNLENSKEVIRTLLKQLQNLQQQLSQNTQVGNKDVNEETNDGAKDSSTQLMKETQDTNDIIQITAEESDDELLKSDKNLFHDVTVMESFDFENCVEEKECENELYESTDKDLIITNEDEIDDEILPSNIQETIGDFEASNVLEESKNQESFECDVCGKTCSNANSIRYHMKKLHGEKGQVNHHQCTVNTRWK